MFSRLFLKGIRVCNFLKLQSSYSVFAVPSPGKYQVLILKTIVSPGLKRDLLRSCFIFPWCVLTKEKRNTLSIFRLHLMMAVPCAFSIRACSPCQIHRILMVRRALAALLLRLLQWVEPERVVYTTIQSRRPEARARIADQDTTVLIRRNFHGYLILISIFLSGVIVGKAIW